ncbi:glycosyltransferase [Natrinema versiforme]|uniref:glycosyltransferase n=1 Tax=Natrinema versiforme TaxID=88724 RepID=UPI0023A9206D|nr:glycosyltransferase [Natrinema versiforme]
MEHKNVDLLLEAFDRVAETDPDITLSLIDNGPERDALERQAQTLDLADRVTMLGFLEEYNDAHMRASDISETCRAPAGPM